MQYGDNRVKKIVIPANLKGEARREYIRHAARVPMYGTSQLPEYKPADRDGWKQIF